jgi:hypothetical protein
MTMDLPEPERWSSRPAGGSAPEDKFGEALRLVAAATQPMATPGAGRPRFLRQSRATRRPLPLAVAAFCVVTGGAVWAMLRSGASQPPGAPPIARPNSDRANAVSVDAPITPAIPAPLTIISDRAASRSRPGPPSEAVLLWSAYRLLHQQHDPRAALAKLDQHRRRFPASELHTEASLARAEALVQLGRRAEAARVVDDLAPEIAPAARRRLGLTP